MPPRKKVSSKADPNSPQTEKEVSELQNIAHKQAVTGEKDSTTQENQEKAQEKISSLFEKIAFLKLSPASKEAISTKIREESSGSRLYWMEIVLSSLIATFGLLQNSVAVIIGAMLIAPLFTPIQGIAFGMSTGQPSHFYRSSKLMVLSVLVSVGVAALFTLLVPLRSETPEILARTAPNLLDLFIAIASGILALLAIYYEKLSQSIAGVAMAAALMPPLSVIGIEIALGNLALAWGSFFLFVTNLFAILVVGLIVFIFYGFYPHQLDSQKRALRAGFTLFIMIGIISFPLFSSLVNIADKIKVQQQAEQILTETLAEAIPTAELDQLELTQHTTELAGFESSIKIPENETFFAETREVLREKLEQSLQRKVNLKMDIIPTASIISQEEYQEGLAPKTDQQIRNRVRELLTEPGMDATVIEIAVFSSADTSEQGEELESPDAWSVRSVFSLAPGVAFSQEKKDSLESTLAEAFPNQELTFFWAPLSQREIAETTEKQRSPQELYHQELTLTWESYLESTLPTTAILKSVEISWNLAESDDRTELNFSEEMIEQYYVDIELYTLANDEDFMRSAEQRIRSHARRSYEQPVTITLRTFPYQTEVFTTKPPVRQRAENSESSSEIESSL